MPRWLRVVLILATVLWALAGAASLLVVLFVPMLFDAPGSTSDPFAVTLAVSIVLFPLACLVSIVGSWIGYRKRRLRGSILFALLPLLPVAGALFAMVGHEAFAGGRFGY